MNSDISLLDMVIEPHVEPCQVLSSPQPNARAEPQHVRKVGDEGAVKATSVSAD